MEKLERGGGLILSYRRDHDGAFQQHEATARDAFEELSIGRSDPDRQREDECAEQLGSDDPSVSFPRSCGTSRDFCEGYQPNASVRELRFRGGGESGTETPGTENVDCVKRG